MTYPDSVRYLYALGNELKVGAKFGLERMQSLVHTLGHPERGIATIHVAGTNGKGSTCAMIESIARAAGIRTGLNTSPHLIEPAERTRIGGKQASEADFAAAFEVVHHAAERLLAEGQIDAHPSYFETVTAMAFILFRDAGCELNIIEVGLGGRLDATNVVKPTVTVITPVSFDHESFLGNTLASIAFEKAGILKPAVPLVLGKQLPEAEAVILQRAYELSCSVTRAADHESEPIACNLLGKHQLDNARAARLVARELGIGEEEIRRGLSSVRWPGRLEWMSQAPDLVLDGAHNPAGAAALAEYIQETFAGRPIWLVYGAMRDKAVDEVTATLFPLADHLILTAPDFPRALRPELILSTYHHANASMAPTVVEAIEQARQAPTDAVVFITGSLYLVGEARKILLVNPAMHKPD